MANGETVTGIPVPTLAPPQLPEYQNQIAFVPREPPVFERTTLLPRQTLEEVAVAEVGLVDEIFTFRIYVVQEVVLHEPSNLTK